MRSLLVSPATSAALVVALASLMSGAACTCGGDGLTQLHARLDANPRALAFDDTYVGGARTLTLTLTSTGTAPVQLSAPAIDDGDASFTLGDEFPDGLRAGEIADVSVTFAPGAVGAHAGTLHIASDAEDHPALAIDLAGAGLAPLDCDDGEQCTDDSFDADAGACHNDDRSGACDDGNACTENDRCAHGDCVGDAIECHDALSCTQDVCDAAVGCAFLPNDNACADADPCTLDRCDPSALFGTGCTHPPAPDGTPCGSFEQCVSVDVCVAQTCTTVEFPDGVPCNDFDLCTDTDVCTDDVCAGTRIHAPPSVVSESFRVTNPRLIANNALLFFEPELVIMPFDSLEPVAVAAAQGQAAVLQPAAAGAAQHLAVSSEHSDGVVTLVDVTDPHAPALTASIPFGEAKLVGADDARVYACDVDPQLGLPILVGIAWDDGAVASVADDDGLCIVAGNTGVSVARSGPLVVTNGALQHGKLFSLDAAGAHLRATLADLPDGIFPRIDGTRAAVSTIIDGAPAFFFLDLTNPDQPRSARWQPPASLGDSNALAITAVGDGYAYLTTVAGPVRVALDDIDAPLVDDAWHVDGVADSFFVAATAPSFVVLSSASGSMFVATTAAGAEAPTPLPGTGAILDVVGGVPGDLDALIDGNWLAVNRFGLIPFRDDDDGDPVFFHASDKSFKDALVVDASAGGSAPRVLGLSTRVLSGTLSDFPGAGGREDGSGSGFEAAFGPFVPIDPVDITPAVAVLAGDGTVTAHALALTLPAGRDRLRAAAIEGCFGAGVVECSDASCAPAAMTLSACEGQHEITALSSISLSFAASDVVSAEHHGDHVTLLASNRAALVDISQPLLPVAIEAAVPEIADARFAAAAFADDTWIIVATYGDDARAARAVVFDTSTGVALRKTAFDVGAAPLAASHDRVVRRPLVVNSHQAVINDWRPLDPANDPADAITGHDVTFFNLDVEPPAAGAAVDVAGPPLRAFTRPIGIVLVRRDGVTVIRPDCP